MVFAQGSETDWEFSACFVDDFHDVQQIAPRAGETVKLPNDKRVTGTNLIQHALKFRPLPAGAGDLLAEYSLAAGFLQSL